MNKPGLIGLLVVCVVAGAAASMYAQKASNDEVGPAAIDLAESTVSVQAADIQAVDVPSQAPDAAEVSPADTQTSEQTNAAAASEKPARETAALEQRLTDVDRALPAFELRELDDTVWNVESLKGRPWVINFWATWCPPCIEEIPSMNAAYEYLEPKGIGMLAINAGEGAIPVETFLEKIAIDFPNVLGDADTLPNWSVRALPTTIVIDAEGKIIYEALGPREWDDEKLLQRVVDLL